MAMTCAHAHKHIPTIAQASRMDPTRTLTLRNRWIRDFNARFRRLKAVIRRAIVEKDVLALKDTPAPMTIQPRPRILQLDVDAIIEGLRERQFEFTRSSAKIEAFMRWLDEMEAREILEVTVRPGTIRGIEEAWTDIYVRAAYQKGIQQADAELRKAGYPRPEFAGGDYVRVMFNQPFHADRVGLLYTRVFEELKGIDAAMDQALSRTLAEGMAQGLHPWDIADNIVDRVDKIGLTRGRMIARTETIRAHAEATLAEYENAGVEGVDVKAEWLASATACDICRPLEGRVFTIEEARGMIPAHPNCRCTWRPAEVGEDVKARWGNLERRRLYGVSI